MSLNLLKKNIEEEKSLVKRLENLSIRYLQLPQNFPDKAIIGNAMDSTEKQIQILNESVSPLIKNITLAKPLPSESYKDEEVKEVISISHEIGGVGSIIAINKKDRNNYLEQLHISETSLKELRKKKKERGEGIITEYKKPRGYVKLSNKFFGEYSRNLVEKNYFNELKEALTKGNFTILTSSYISMIFLTTLLSVFAGIILTLFFLLIGISTASPFIYLVDFSEANILLRLLKVIWLIPVIPLITFLTIYFYPSMERDSLERNIDYELPFATIQMSAIAGADIEPSNIFRIITLSKEYPYIRNEAKKLMNQINLYGYDLVTALRNIAIASPSRSWADLINGISTTIRSGGDLARYLNKKSETLLFEYKLKREKATKSAETFMDIYISVVIAAPMLMMLLLIMINISGIGINITIPALTIIVISIVGLINIIFLVFLHLSQRKI